MKRFWAFAPLVALVFIAAAAAMVLLRPGQRETITEGLVGQPAPAYALATLGDRGTVTPAAFAGRPYVINFFASWCAPCRVEHPMLLALKEQGVTILGVAYKDQRPDALLRDLGDPFAAVGLDPDGRYGLQMGLAGVPETFVVGPDGRIRALVRGPLDEELVRTRILPALE
ncbi:MAG: DsbE family thiol:disulfide interchange protein [Hyphomonadaceae bacterium]|nr:DsbE family thiol:disulfide interchange protein [Hyphomonadaceae bacterium]